MKLRRILIYLIILLVIGGYALYDKKQRQEQTAAEEKSSKLLQLDKDKINAIELRSKDGGVTKLQKPADIWVITDPIQTKADAGTTSSIIQSAYEAKPEKTLSERETNWTEYGLADPEFSMTLFAPEKSTTINFGEMNPSRTGYYVRIDDQPKLYLVADTLRNALRKSLLDLRDKSVVNIATDDVDYLAIKKDEGSIQLKRESDEEWYIVEPIRSKAKKSTLTALVRSLTTFNADEVIDVPGKPLNFYGLDRPMATVELKGKNFQQTLEIGGPQIKEDGSKSETKLYAKIREREPIYVIENRIPKSLKVAADDYKNRNLVFFKPDEIRQLEVILDGKTWEAAKSPEGKWTLNQPEKRESMEAWLVSSILWDIKDLEWKSSIKSNQEDFPAVGLETPELMIKLIKSNDEIVEIRASRQKTSGIDKGDSSLNESKTSTTDLVAITNPSSEEKGLLVIDSNFLTRLKTNLDRLTEKPK